MTAQSFPSRDEMLGGLDQRTLVHNMCRLFGDSLEIPAAFVTFDLETTNVSPQAGVIWQIGLCEHLQGEPLPDQAQGRALYPARSETVLLANQFEIQRRAEKIAEEFKIGMPEAVEASTVDYLETQKLLGKDTREVLDYTATLLKSYLADGFPVVGHNLISFDCPFFEAECARNGVDFKFPEESVYDTGMIIKAAKLGRRILDSESSRRFFASVGGVRAKGVYYAIERFCVPYWNMRERYGVDLAAAHDAGYDCWLTGLILKNLMADARGETPATV